MSNCLLCSQVLRKKQTFTELLLFKRPEIGICATCFHSFKEIAEQHCSLCYRSGISGICKDCGYWQQEGKQVDHRALFQYTEEMADYFSKYKFQGDYILRTVFAKQVRQVLKNYSDYTVVPIPLSPQRLAERGFNQVEGLLDAAEIAYQPLLGKFESQKQSSKNRKERLATKNSFYLLEENMLPNKLLLVDDIYTTGATFQAAIEVLMKTGKKEIKTFSLAR